MIVTFAPPANWYEVLHGRRVVAHAHPSRASAELKTREELMREFGRERERKGSTIEARKR